MKVLKRFIIVVWVLLCFSTLVNADVNVTYDTSTVSNCMTYQIIDDVNIKYLNEYTYSIFLNNQLLGNFKKGDSICIPDNNTLKIYVPAPISTNFNTGWDLAKTYFVIALMFVLVFIVAIGIFAYALRRTIWR